MIAKILLIGCGDIAIRLAAHLPGNFECHGLRRRVERLPPSIRPIPWDLNERDGLAERVSGFDAVVITVVPDSPDESGYRRAYVENMETLVAALESAGKLPKLVIFVSSTSVYGQSRGEWIDEHSPAEPGNFRGRMVLRGEQLLRASALPRCVVRFSGIYGPGRERLLRQVAEGERSERDGDFSNRIHSEDCAGVLAHILQRKLADEPVQELYLASDCEPVPVAAVKSWLAERMEVVSPRHEASQQAGGKRCRNQRLLASGYRFRYPTFREGYGSMLEEKKI